MKYEDAYNANGCSISSLMDDMMHFVKSDLVHLADHSLYWRIRLYNLHVNMMLILFLKSISFKWI